STVQFGTGASIITNGFYVIGNRTNISSNSFLYDLRQRGPGWTSTAPDVSPAPLQFAEMGRSVAIAGTTAVIGAPSYGNHGAVFVFKQLPNSDPDADPVWELHAQIDAPGFGSGDQFGASLAINGEDLIVGAPGRNGGMGGA